MNMDIDELTKRAKKEKKGVMSISIEPTKAKAFRDECEKRGSSYSSIITEMIEDYLKKCKRKK